MNYFTDEKYYNTLNNYYRSRFASKVFKVALNGDFTCPNRDGTISKAGCIFCSDSGSGEYGGSFSQDLQTQFNTILEMMKRKWKDGKYIVYFQSFSNTYGPIKKLKRIYNEALNLDPNIIGLSIGTRPDCFDNQIYDLLEEINQKTYLTVELGLQSMHDKTLNLINRGHDLQTFEEAVINLRKRNIDVIVHIINGLPFETERDMLETIDYLNTLDIQGIKIHMLYILEDTPLEKYYKFHPFAILSLKEYVEITVKQLTILNPKVIVHRITGDPPKEQLIAPKWTLKKFIVANEIDKFMRKRDFYQGMNFMGEKE